MSLTGRTQNISAVNVNTASGRAQRGTRARAGRNSTRRTKASTAMFTRKKPNIATLRGSNANPTLNTAANGG